MNAGAISHMCFVVSAQNKVAMIIRAADEIGPLWHRKRIFFVLPLFVHNFAIFCNSRLAKSLLPAQYSTMTNFFCSNYFLLGDWLEQSDKFWPPNFLWPKVLFKCETIMKSIVAKPCFEIVFISVFLWYSQKSRWTLFQVKMIKWLMVCAFLTVPNVFGEQSSLDANCIVTGIVRYLCSCMCAQSIQTYLTKNHTMWMSRLNGSLQLRSAAVWRFSLS